MIASVEYDEIKVMYSNYEEYYLARTQEEGMSNEIRVDAHVLEEQIRYYTQQNPESPSGMDKKYKAPKSRSTTTPPLFNYENTEDIDLENEYASARNEYTEYDIY